MITELTTQVCIIGSGFCGYAAFKSLAAMGIEAIVIEGGKSQTPKKISEQKYYETILESEYCGIVNGRNVFGNIEPSFRDRKFTLGGSSECWAGRIKPLEESTLRNCYESAPHLSWGELKIKCYDEQSLKLLNSPILDFDPKKVAGSLGVQLPNLPNGLYYTTYAWASHPLRTKSFWSTISTDNPEAIVDKSKSVLTGYRLLKIDSNFEGVSSLRFKNEDDEALIVNAKAFILATGGIENAKLVKSLQIDNPSKFSKSLNYLGHFQEHPNIYSYAFFRKGNKNLPSCVMERVPVRRNSKGIINNGYIQIAIAGWDGLGTPKASFSVAKPTGSLIARIRGLANSCIGNPIADSLKWRINCRGEQSPLMNSRVTFENDKTSLNWKVNSSDFSYYSEYLKRFCSFMVAEEFFKEVILKDPALTDIAVPSSVTGGAHHMSTVAYTDNDISLLNADFSLCDFENLYVVGSTSFPVSGFENPTLAAMSTALVAAEAIAKKFFD